jgi:hypothetical protein
MSPHPLAARAGVQTPYGSVVVADLTAYRLLLSLAGRPLDAVRVHRARADTP